MLAGDDLHYGVESGASIRLRGERGLRKCYGGLTEGSRSVNAPIGRGESSGLSAPSGSSAAILVPQSPA